MAKSRLAASRNQNKPITQPKIEDNVTSLDLTFELQPRGKRSIKFNLLDWCHERCDPQKPLALPSRLIQMQKLMAWVVREKKNQTSHGTIIRKLRSLNQYICFCDFKKCDPFSKKGYLAYAGNAGQLRNLVQAGVEPKTYQFQYADGEKTGLSESTAANQKFQLNLMLQLFDFDVSDWQASIKPFSRTRIEASTKPYTSEEWSALVKRTQLFFFSLVTKLIAFKEENPEAPPPAILDEIIVNREDNRDITITVGKKSKGEAKDGAASPFNQCMAAAYTLFAYYTAFNDTVIKDIRHPIQVVTPKSEGRTSKTVQVRGYKGRAAKDVHALFAASEENEHKEATETAAGFIVADINKRDSVGSVDGITFIQTLELFSKTYSDDPFDTLIYFLNKEGKKTTIDMHHSLIYLSENLNLLSVRRGELTEHLIKTYTDIVENNTESTFCWTKREDGARVMNRQRIVMTKRSVTHQATPIAYTAISCMTDRSLRNALLPLTYSEKDAQGAITISFRYLDDSTGNFLVPAKYKTFLQLVEKYAASRNTLPTGGRGSSSPPHFYCR